MFQIDLKSRKAIYLQIIDNVKRLIITGVLEPNSRVLSIREMAAQLMVNPNTVQKAYRNLENQGYFYTVLGQGNFIASPPVRRKSKEVETLYLGLKNHVQELVFRGESKEEIINFIESEGANDTN